MKKIAAGAEAQTELVGQASKVITEMAGSHPAHRRQRRGRGARRRRDHRRRRGGLQGRAARRREGEEGVQPHRDRQPRGVRLRREDAGDLARSSTPSPRWRSRRTCSRSTPPSRRRAPASTAAASRWSPTRCASWPRARAAAPSRSPSWRATSPASPPRSCRAMKEGIEELAEGREDLTTIVRSMGAITDTARKGAEKVHLISESAARAAEGQRGDGAGHPGNLAGGARERRLHRGDPAGDAGADARRGPDDLRRPGADQPLASSCRTWSAASGSTGEPLARRPLCGTSSSGSRRNATRCRSRRCARWWYLPGASPACPAPRRRSRGVMNLRGPGRHGGGAAAVAGAAGGAAPAAACSCWTAGAGTWGSW